MTRARRAAAVAALVVLITGCGSAEGTAVPRVAASSPTPSVHVTSRGDLSSPAEKEIAMELVSSAENSTLDWRAQYRYLQDIHDGRGYTGGIIGFTSGTGDMLHLVKNYARVAPDAPLTRFVPALKKVNGTASHAGLGHPFERAWVKAAADPAFQRVQDHLRDAVYFDPAVRTAKRDGLGALGQFVYYDAYVVHGPGPDADSFGGIRRAAMRNARTPARGGSVTTYLKAFFAARIVVMRKEAAHQDISRITDAQERFLREGNLALRPPLRWHVYGDAYQILH
jgi:chitosanase